MQEKRKHNQSHLKVCMVGDRASRGEAVVFWGRPDKCTPDTWTDGHLREWLQYVSHVTTAVKRRIHRWSWETFYNLNLIIRYLILNFGCLWFHLQNRSNRFWIRTHFAVSWRIGHHIHAIDFRSLASVPKTQTMIMSKQRKGQTIIKAHTVRLLFHLQLWYKI